MTTKLPTVAEYMDKYVDVVSPDMDIVEAVNFLLQKRVTGAPVVANGKLQGMLTELDCLKLLTHAAGREGIKGTVKDYMTHDVQAIPPTMDIYFVAGLFMRVNFRRFPVVEDGKLVGAITRFDILRAVKAGLGELRRAPAGPPEMRPH